MGASNLSIFQPHCGQLLFNIRWVNPLMYDWLYLWENMNLIEISDVIWENSTVINFGYTESWSDFTFLKKWFDEFYPNIYRNKASGWYWFGVNFNLEEFSNLEIPEGLPDRACRIRDVFNHNKRLFQNELVHCKSRIPIVYNGHENSVFDRIRQHFAVRNNNNGALGLIHYESLSRFQWFVKIFHQGNINTLSTLTSDEISQMSLLCQNKTGRTAIEQVWRSKYGWPALSKA